MQGSSRPRSRPDRARTPPWHRGCIDGDTGNCGKIGRQADTGTRTMQDDVFADRYSRQIRLPLVEEKGQRAIRDAAVLIVGMGGLGSPVAMYLAAAGVGRLTIADFDVVDLSNLQRQIVHAHDDIGLLKTQSAARR
ncbi:MAG: hypothetical protein F4Z52_00325, partial [Gammaproteobacteria bacterium]|nr:hypothetical protein [Gammaproteobacteria bacterium]